jgi:hypothetical protein
MDETKQPTTTEFNPDHPRPYRWVFVVSVEAGETQVADGFNPFDPECDLSPYEVLDHIVGNVDSWGEMAIEITEARPLAVPPRGHIARAQGSKISADVSERDRKIIANAIYRLLDDGADEERLRQFADSLHMDADGDDIKLVRETIDSIEHPD